MRGIKYILILPLILMFECVHRQNAFKLYKTQALFNQRYILNHSTRKFCRSFTRLV